MTYTQETLRALVVEMTRDALASDTLVVTREATVSKNDVAKLRSAVWHVNKKFTSTHAEFSLVNASKSSDLLAAMLNETNDEHVFELKLDAEFVAKLKK